MSGSGVFLGDGQLEKGEAASLQMVQQDFRPYSDEDESTDDLHLPLEKRAAAVADENSRC
jgi:hypothetical protein